MSKLTELDQHNSGTREGGLTLEDSKYKVSWTTHIVRPEGIKA